MNEKNTVFDTISEISSNVPKVYEAGYAKGEKEGYDAGAKSEYDAFWDAYQNKGDKREYYFCFSGTAWNDKTFKPKYDITMTHSGIYTFAYNAVTDIAESLNGCGVSLDTSGVKNASYLFYAARTKSLPVIDLSTATNLTYAFADNGWLERIEKLVFSSNITTTSQCFTGCKKLKDVAFEGEMISSLSMSSCEVLSADSIASLFGCLSDSASGKKLTLSKAAVDKGFEINEGANDGSGATVWLMLVDSKPNWTISLV
ncbi:MAG: hypothetical protein E7649_07370 [Ruminococcaceae bacterium]|nr:hypothetical protein [Oscillospiraceae bacterium]